MLVARRIAALLLGVSSFLCYAGDLSNRPAPDFHLNDAAGHSISLSEYKGKVVLVEFFLTTCPHCQKLAPILQGVHNRFKGRVAVIGIAAFPATAQAAAEFAQTYRLTFPVVADPANTAVTAFLKSDSFSVPHIFVVDQAGYIRDDFIQNPSNAEFFTPEGLSRLLQGYLGRK